MQILAATDFSTRSQRALRRAGLLAREKSFELAIVHVVDDDQPARLVDLEKRESERYLAEQIDTLAELRGVDCRALVVVGDPFDSILRAAASVAAELVVMGVHRKQFLGDIFIGTTVERVIRAAPCPVLMVNHEPTDVYRLVLAAVDTVSPSAKAMKTVETLRLLENAKLTLVHAIHAPARGKLALAGVDNGQIEQYLAAERDRARAELRAYFAANDIDIEAHPMRIEEGSPFATIAAAVRDLMPDLVLIGTHGRTGVAKVLLGSVTTDVLRFIDTDILVVSPDK